MHLGRFINYLRHQNRAERLEAHSGLRWHFGVLWSSPKPYSTLIESLESLSDLLRGPIEPRIRAGRRGCDEDPGVAHGGHGALSRSGFGVLPGFSGFGFFRVPGGGGVQGFREFEEIWALGLRVAGDMEFRLPASPQAGKTFFGLRARMIWIMFAQNKYSED